MTVLTALECDGDGSLTCQEVRGRPHPMQVAFKRLIGQGSTVTQLRRYARNRGWRCGTQDRCPACAAAAKRAQGQ